MGQASVAGIPDMLYQNDGIYGNFMNVIMEKEIMVPKMVGRQCSSTRVQTRSEVQEEGEEKKGYKYSIWGPTCDSIDCVVREAVFDCEVKTGDWLMYRNMGGE